MQWKLLLLLAWLVLGGGGCRTGASLQTEGHVPRGTGSEQDYLLRAIDDALTQTPSVMPSVPSQQCSHKAI